MRSKSKLPIAAGVVALALGAMILWAQVSTVTPNLNLQVPAYNQANWQVPIIYDLNTLDSILGGTQTLPTGSTPTISQNANWVTANTSATVITNLLGGLPGQRLTLLCGVGDAFTSIPGSANMTVLGSWTCGTSYSITFVLTGTVWTELARSGGNSTTSATNLVGPGTITGNYTHSGAETFNGTITAPAVINLEGLRFADQFANINAAVTAASTTGAVIIPPTYTGTDAANTTNAPILDFRQNSQGGIGFWHGVRSLFPTSNSNFPGGNDFDVNAFGPADIHLNNNQVDCTSTTTINAGTNTITVGTCAAGNGGPSGTTAVLSNAAGVTIVLEPGTANQEAIPAANWSILSATTLSVTNSLTHTQPYTVRQQGPLIANGNVFFYGCPAGTLFYGFGTLTGNQPVFNLPCNTGATWPNGGIQIIAPLTGGNTSPTNNLLFRNFSTSSAFIWRSFANVSIMSLTDTGQLTTSGQITTTISTGTAPLAVASTTPVANLTVQNCATCSIISNLPTTILGLARTSVAGSITLLAANSCGDTVTVTVSGATISMDAHASGTISAGLIERAWVSSPNTVSVQYCNVTTSGITPSAATLQVTVVQ